MTKAFVQQCPRKRFPPGLWEMSLHFSRYNTKMLHMFQHLAKQMLSSPLGTYSYQASSSPKQKVSEPGRVWSWVILEGSIFGASTSSGPHGCAQKRLSQEIGDLRTKDPSYRWVRCRIQGFRIRVDRSGIGFSLVPDFAAESPDLAALMKISCGRCLHLRRL